MILLDALKEEQLESKETIVHCFLTCLCLSLHPFVPLEHTVLLFPSLPLLCKLATVRWRIEVVEAQVEDSILGFEEVPAKVVTIVSLFLLIEISISSLIHVHKYEYCIYGCIYLLIHDCLYMLE